MDGSPVITIVAMDSREERESHGVVGVSYREPQWLPEEFRAEGTKASQNTIGATASVPSRGLR